MKERCERVKKVLNVLGIIGSMFLTVSLTTIMICFVFLLNIKFAVNKSGINKLLNNIDIVETIKEIDGGVVWEDLTQISEDTNLTEEELEAILNNEELKTEFSEIFDGVIASITSEEAYKVSKTQITDIINLVIDEYNKVADEKITEEERKEALAEINDEFINDINTSLEEINLSKILAEENMPLFRAIDFIIFGGFVYALTVAIVVIIALIGLLRWSPYKWMPYAGVAATITSFITFITGLFIKLITIEDADISKFIIPFKSSASSNFYISAFILLAIAVLLFVLNHVIKKQQAPVINEEPIAIETTEEPKEN